MKTLNITKVAQKQGCTATTSRGLLKWIKSHPQPVSLWGGAESAAKTKCDQPAIPTRYTSGAPLEDVDLCRIALENGRENNPRKRNIYSGKPRLNGTPYQEREEAINYKGSFRGWKGSEIHCDYQSAVFVSRSGRTAILKQLGVRSKPIVAPSGMTWQQDDNGILLVRLSDGMDYHPTLEDYKAKNLITRVRASMAKNYSARLANKRAKRETARFEKVYQQQTKSTRVTLQDSLRAGNCVQGSIVFAEIKLHISRDELLASKHLISFSAATLRRVANGESQKVEAAIRQAWMRETTVCI